MRLTTLCIDGGASELPPSLFMFSQFLHLNQAGVQHLICDLTDAQPSTI